MNASFKLCQRGSRYLATLEFAEFKPACVEWELQNAALGQASHHLNRVLDSIGNLFKRAESNKVAINDLDKKQSDAITNLESSADESLGQTG